MSLIFRCDVCEERIMEVDVPLLSLLPDNLVKALSAYITLCSRCKEELVKLLKERREG